MDLPDPLRLALGRLNGALDALDAAAERRAGAQHLASRDDDRARLAAELGAALARNRALDRAAEEVAARVDRAIAAVRGLLREIAPTDARPPGPA